MEYPRGGAMRNTVIHEDGFQPDVVVNAQRVSDSVMSDSVDGFLDVHSMDENGVTFVVDAQQTDTFLDVFMFPAPEEDPEDQPDTPLEEWIAGVDALLKECEHDNR